MFKQIKAISFYKGYGILRIIILGFGIRIKDLRKRSLTFSERNGYKKYLKIGRYSISFINNN